MEVGRGLGEEKFSNKRREDVNETGQWGYPICYTHYMHSLYTLAKLSKNKPLFKKIKVWPYFQVHLLVCYQQHVTEYETI